MKLFKGLFVLAAYLVAGSAHAAEPVLLGILTDPSCPPRKAMSKTADELRSVRILFAKERDAWMPLISKKVTEPFDLSNRTWTIAFDGRNFGSVKSLDLITDNERDDPRDKIYQLTPGQQPPQTFNRDSGFGGWCNFPIYRPLVLVSQPNYRDPEKWKPFKPGDSYRYLVMDKVREVMAASICPESKDGKEIDVPISPEALSEITTANLTLEKSYRDRAGRELVSVKLETEFTVACYIEEYPYLGRLIFLKEGDEVRFIGGELQLIDAGDYDNDGRSELMFWHSGYNEDGYTLFYDDFRKRADYLWSYH